MKTRETVQAPNEHGVKAGSNEIDELACGGCYGDVYRRNSFFVRSNPAIIQDWAANGNIQTRKD